MLAYQRRRNRIAGISWRNAMAVAGWRIGVVAAKLSLASASAAAGWPGAIMAYQRNGKAAWRGGIES